jgi:tRNA nucleotidyltransferase/poly(A) polymerase
MTIDKYNSIANQFPNAVLVGGTVRNHLLGLSSAKSDIDLLVCDSDMYLSEYIAEHLASAEKLKLVDSTMRLRLQCGTVVDLTVTPDSYYKNMRLRDFSINAFSYDARTEQVTNWCGGFADIMHKRIRTCSSPEDTLLADPCRIIRAVRFKAQMSQLTGETWCYDEHLTYCLSRKVNTLCQALAKCDRSRVRNEMTYMLKTVPADVMYAELSQLPKQLVKCMLKTAGGYLSLVGT